MYTYEALSKYLPTSFKLHTYMYRISLVVYGRYQNTRLIYLPTWQHSWTLKNNKKTILCMYAFWVVRAWIVYKWWLQLSRNFISWVRVESGLVWTGLHNPIFATLTSTRFLEWWKSVCRPENGKSSIFPAQGRQRLCLTDDKRLWLKPLHIYIACLNKKCTFWPEVKITNW
jgi:hypothetical protein